MTSREGTQPVTGGARILARCVQFIPGADDGQRKLLAATSPEFLAELQLQARTNARAIRQNRWEMLGHAFDLTGTIDWHVDPRTGYRWERRFYAELPLYDLPGKTDVKYPWELSRQQFLPELARDYLLNGSHESAHRARDLIVDWIDANPLYEGVNWTSSLEVAMRSISWIWTLSGLAKWDGWMANDLARIESSLADHAAYLADNFSYYSSPYNHLVGEAAGLLCLSQLLEEHPSSLHWNSQSRQVLLKSGPAQFYRDHFCVEQAVGYHYYTLGFLVTAWLAARTTDRPLLELKDVIQDGFRSGMSFRQPDGDWPAIGDLDSARALPVFHENYWSFDSLSNLAAAMFGDAELKTGNGAGAELYWLLGMEGVKDWNRLSGRTSDTAHRVYKDAGYAIASNQLDWMLFDAGPIAHGLFPDNTPSTAHGHADTLQVLFHLNGEAVLADGGMPFYGGSPEWVSYFRSPAAHNTVQIEGADVVRRAGRLAWSHEVERPNLDATFDEAAWLCGGQLTWPGVSHRRQICCLPGHGLWIADLIETDRPRKATWFWQLPDRLIELCTPTLAAWDSLSLSVTSSDGEGELALSSTIETSPIGWRCLGYGQRQPMQRLSLDRNVSSRLLILTSVGHAVRPELGIAFGDFQLAEFTTNETDGHARRALAMCEWLIPHDVLAPSHGRLQHASTR